MPEVKCCCFLLQLKADSVIAKYLSEVNLQNALIRKTLQQLVVVRSLNSISKSIDINPQNGQFTNLNYSAEKHERIVAT